VPGDVECAPGYHGEEVWVMGRAQSLGELIGRDTSMATINDRMRLAALVDRLIYGSEETFKAEDASEVLSLVRGTRPPQSFSVQVKGTAGRRGTQGAAAGFGSVRIDEERKLDFDTDAAAGVRAGQWRVLHEGGGLIAKESVVIEQMMSDAAEPGRSARIDFVRGEAREMRIRKARSIGFPIFWMPKAGWLWVNVGLPYFAPWKVPDTTPAVEADPYDGSKACGRDGMRMVGA
jgi:hypothetical protein